MSDVCQICGVPQADDLFSAVTQEPVCSLCKLVFLGGLPTTSERIDRVRAQLGLEAGSFADEEDDPDDDGFDPDWDEEEEFVCPTS